MNARTKRIHMLEIQLEHDFSRYEREKAAGNFVQANNWFSAAAKTASILTAFRGTQLVLTPNEAREAAGLRPVEQDLERVELLATQGEKHFPLATSPEAIQQWFTETGERLMAKYGPGDIETWGKPHPSDRVFGWKWKSRD